MAEKCNDPAWRGCWPFQMDAFRNRDLTPINTTTEATIHPHFRGRPILMFSRTPNLGSGFLQSRPGGGLLYICLDDLVEGQDYFVWPKTGDVHVLAEVVFDHAEEVPI